MTEVARYYHSVTDVGRQREANEDSRAEYALGDGGVLLVVADGMGGHENGEVASRIAVEALGQIFQNSPAPDPRDKLKNGMLVANQRIVSEAERLKVEGMGTTAVAAYVRGSRAYVAHVGDSRLYHVRDGALIWRTTDHTRVQKMVQMGILSAEEAKDHPDANVVSRALGFAQLADGSALEPEVQDEPLDLRPGDSLILCTDGLYDGVTDAEVAQTVAGRTAKDGAQALVDLANERGGHDNITVTVLHYGRDIGSRPAPASSKSLGPGGRRVTAHDEGSGKPAAGNGGAAGKGDAAAGSASKGSARASAPAAAAPPAPDDGRRRKGLLLILAGVALLGAGGVFYWLSRPKPKSPGGGVPGAVDAALPGPVAGGPDDAGAGTPALEVDAAVPAPGELFGTSPSPTSRPRRKGDGGVAAAGGHDGGAAGLSVTPSATPSASPAAGRDGGVRPRGTTSSPTPTPASTARPSPSASPTSSAKPSPSPTTSARPSPTTSARPSPSPTTSAKPSPSPTTSAKPSPSPTTTAKPSPTPRPSAKHDEGTVE
ncbi:MAG: protein phosphatase 2C domain-containing protein [Deltaproteobacteria bacterium]|nr:protein phosphatase 2C domain-containing protein [Deltaproteobacteria bacterium]